MEYMLTHEYSICRYIYIYTMIHQMSVVNSSCTEMLLPRQWKCPRCHSPESVHQVLVMTNIAMVKPWPIEIAWFTGLSSMVMFHGEL